jgi:hypothetical protein
VARAVAAKTVQPELDDEEIEADDFDVPVEDDGDIRSKGTRHTHRDPFVEQVLKEQGFNFKYVEDLVSADFNDKASLENQNRIGGLIPDAIRRYRMVIRSGGSLPAGVHRKGRNGLLVVSGNHRRRAYESERVPFASYLLTDNDVLISRIHALGIELNSVNGESVPELDRILQALQLVNGGWKLHDASRKAAVSPAKVSAALNKEKAAYRAGAVGVIPEKWGALPQVVQNMLASIHTDEGFGAMLHLVIDAGLNKGDIDGIVQRMQTSKSAKRQVEIVQKVRESPEIQAMIRKGGKSRTKARGQAPTPRTVTARTLGMVDSIPDAAELEKYYPTEEERRELASSFDAAIKRLQVVRKELLRG